MVTELKGPTATLGKASFTSRSALSLHQATRCVSSGRLGAHAVPQPAALLLGVTHANGYQQRQQVMAAAYAPRASEHGSPNVWSSPTVVGDLDHVPTAPTLWDTFVKWSRTLLGAVVLVQVVFLSMLGVKPAMATPKATQDRYPAAAVTRRTYQPVAELASRSTGTLDVAELIAKPEVRVVAGIASAALAYVALRAQQQQQQQQTASSGYRGYKPEPMPEDYAAKADRLERLYYEIEELKKRQTREWELALKTMDEDSAVEFTTSATRGRTSGVPKAPAAAAPAVTQPAPKAQPVPVRASPLPQPATAVVVTTPAPVTESVIAVTIPQPTTALTLTAPASAPQRATAPTGTSPAAQQAEGQKGGWALLWADALLTRTLEAQEAKKQQRKHRVDSEASMQRTFEGVEPVHELLKAAVDSKEFTDPKYDPIRDVLSNLDAPTGAHKYDLVKSLLRGFREAAAQADANAAQADIARADKAKAEAAASQDPATRKYDLMYDLLRSLRTSGDYATFVASSKPRYDPVWLVLNAQPLTGLAKYDVLGQLLHAALVASPQHNKYDPLSFILKAEPLPSRGHKYDIVEALLKGEWQRPLEGGLDNLPGWDPVSTVRKAMYAPPKPRVVSKYDLLGQIVDALSTLPDKLSSGEWAREQLPNPMRHLLPDYEQGRTVSKYNLIDQLVDNAATLPERLANGSWAKEQAADPLRSLSPERTGPRTVSKYDPIGQLLNVAATLPDDLASGRWAAKQPRDPILGALKSVAAPIKDIASSAGEVVKEKPETKAFKASAPAPAPVKVEVKVDKTSPLAPEAEVQVQPSILSSLQQQMAQYQQEQKEQHCKQVAAHIGLPLGAATHSADGRLGFSLPADAGKVSLEALKAAAAQVEPAVAETVHTDVAVPPAAVTATPVVVAAEVEAPIKVVIDDVAPAQLVRDILRLEAENSRRDNPMEVLPERSRAAFTGLMACREVYTSTSEYLQCHPPLSRVMLAVEQAAAVPMAPAPIWLALFGMRRQMTSAAEAAIPGFLENLPERFAQLRRVLSCCTRVEALNVLCTLRAWAQNSEVEAIESVKVVQMVSAN